MAAASASDRLDRGKTRKAVNALLKWKKLQSQSNQPNGQDLFEENDDFIYLSITHKKIPPKHLRIIPHRIPLAHSILPRDFLLLNVCLIVDGKKITSETANRKLKSLGIHIKQVLKLSKLKSDYNSFDAKKKLFESFDVFLADKNVVPFLPKVLGKVFYKKKKKIPMPVDLTGGCNWKEEINSACSSSLWCLSGGTSCGLKIGRWGTMGSEDIVDNVFTAINEVLQIFPKKWAGVSALHLRFSDSLALPIYDYQPGLLLDKNKLDEGGHSDFQAGKERMKGSELQAKTSKEKGADKDKRSLLQQK